MYIPCVSIRAFLWFPERIDESDCIISAKQIKKSSGVTAIAEQELDDSVKQACIRLRAANCLLLNQAVARRHQR